MKNQTITGVFLLALVIAGCSERASPPTEATAPQKGRDVAQPAALPQPTVADDLLSCDDTPEMEVYCGFRNPEDLVLLPDGETLLVSEMGEFMMDSPGKLSALNPANDQVSAIDIIWPPADQAMQTRGDPTCPAPVAEIFSPHGIDLTTLADGSHQLLVVNHGGREAVEFFQLNKPGDTWQLTWKGCALPPGDPFINDVAGLPDGGFFVTHMWDKSTPFEEVGNKLRAGEKVGWVWEWQPESGFSKVPNSDEMMPNGIAISADGTKLFVNIYMGNKTIKLDRATGAFEGEFEVQQPDNITVDADGNLWVASHKHDPLGQTCALVTEGPCLLPFEVVKANPDTLETEVILHQEGAPMGYATVALKVGDRVYMGSAHGDRISSITAD